MFATSSRIAALFSIFAVTSMPAQVTQAELQWVNGEWERYWRVLQVAGDVAPHPWSNRPFGAAEVARLRAPASHPWEHRVMARPFRIGRVNGAAMPIDVETIFNSAFPYGFNEGPVWAGRGLTTAVRGAVSFSAGPLSASLAPVFFQAQNDPFTIVANGQQGRFVFGFPYPWDADMPQRFGDKPYRRLDPGNSFVRLDAGPVTAGLSTAAQHWGPARDHPLILGSNAGGFPHLFVGSATPVRVGPLRFHGKLMWGKLYESRYTTMEEIAPHRLAAGAVLLITPVRVPGLELGASRFVHSFWTDTVISRSILLRPFSSLLGAGAVNAENQLVSVFARWVFPRGIEAYAEFARDDGNLNFRHLVLEPDHNAGYMVGLQHVWGGTTRGTTRADEGGRARALRRSVVRWEVLNTRNTNPHLPLPQTPFYTHRGIGQGHTYLGRALGSEGAFGGGATSLAFDRYSASGRWSITGTRLMRAEDLRPELRWTAAVNGADVFYTLGTDGIRFRGRTAVTYELTGVYEFNRNFQRDAFNLRAASGLRYAW